MKSLLVSLLVFGITSVANAGLIDIVIVSLGPGPDPVTQPIEPTKEIFIMPSEWVDIDIIYSVDVEGQYLSQFAVTVKLTGLATLDLSDPTLPPGAWDLDWCTLPTEVTPGKEYYMVYTEGMSGSGVPYPGGIAIDHILVHCEDIDFQNPVIVEVLNYTGSESGGLGSVEKSPTGAPVFPDFGSPVTIWIPEPMTIALLALGGLALLRKRRL